MRWSHQNIQTVCSVEPVFLYRHTEQQIHELNHYEAEVSATNGTVTRKYQWFLILTESQELQNTLVVCC